MSALPQTLAAARPDARPLAPAALVLAFQRLPALSLPVDLWECHEDKLPVDLLANPLYLNVLAAAEQHRLRAFRFDRDRRRYLAGRLLLRFTLSRYAAVAPGEWAFVHNAFGRPELAPACLARVRALTPGEPGAQSAARLRFNLSRAGSLVVLAVAQSGEVGVDVEDDQRGGAAEEIAPGVLAESELAALRATPAPLRAEVFLRYWVLKEALAKARGTGLSSDVRRTCFSPPGPGPVRLLHDAGITGDAARWRFEFTRIRDFARVCSCTQICARYSLAIAYRADILEPVRS